MSNLKFEKLSIEDGLSQSTINSIFQDSNGFLWFGTQSGLNKYDGSKFIIYVHDALDSNSISENWINSICEDTLGNIWIGTLGGGLDKFDINKERFIHYKNNPDNNNSICSDRIQVVYCDRNGNIWIGTDGGGLDIYDMKNNIFKHLTHNNKKEDGISSNKVTAIYEDKLNNFWIGTRGGGLCKINKPGKSTETFTTYKNDTSNHFSLSNNNILSIFEDSKNNLWVGTEGGLNKFETAKDRFTIYKNNPKTVFSISNNNVRSILEDKNEMLWIATEGGLNIFDKNSGRFWRNVSDPSKPNSISSDDVRIVFQDKSGIIWIGTKGGGLNKFDWKRKIFKHYKNITGDSNSLIDNNVYSIFIDKSGYLWIGTIKGLHKFDRKRKKLLFVFRHNPVDDTSISDDLVRMIYEDKKGVLWFGTNNGGLNKYIPSKNYFKRYKHDPNNSSSLNNNNVRAISEDSQGNFWIGTWEGLARFDRKQEKFYHFKHNSEDESSISDNRVRCILEDKEGELWIGTYHGLNQFDYKNGKFIHYLHDANDNNSLSHNRILSMHEDTTGVIWIGTYGGGLNKFDKEKKKFTRYTEKNGLADNAIYGVLGDDANNLWISTNKGLSKFDPLLDEFNNFNVNDGLQSNEFNGGAYYKNLSGELFFGGVNGFNSFNPKDIKDNNYIPPIVLTSFKVYDKELKLNQSISTIYEIELSYKQNFISFEFASLDYTNPDKNEYKYKLEGFDKEWINCGHRQFANYTNLDGGKYIFKVKGTNSDGMWNEEGTSVKINIIPPFWETWWFLLIASILIIVITYSVYKLRINNINNQRIKLRIQVDERTADLKAINKNLQRSRIESHRRANQALLLNDVGQKISSNLRLNILLNEVVTIVHNTFNYYGVFLFLLANDGKKLTLQSKSCSNKDMFSKKMDIKIGEGMIGRAALTGNIQLSNDVSKNSDFIRGVNDITKSELAIPLKIGEKIFGVLDIESNELNAFDKTDDVAAVETFSTQIASAINNARLYEQAQNEIKVRKQAEKESRKLAKQSSLLNEVGQRISSELEVNSVLNEIVNSARDAFDYYGVMLLLPDKKNKGLLLQSIAGGYKDVFPKDLYIKNGEGMIGKAFSAKKIQISGDVTRNKDYVMKAEEVTRSEMAVPILDGKKVVGVLDIQSDKLNVFDKTDIATMEIFSTQIAAALRNANLYNQAQQEINERKRTQLELLKSRDNLSLAKKETDNILDNVEEGLFIINNKFKISSQYSNALEMILEQKKLADTNFLEFVKERINVKEYENVKQYLELMFDNNVSENTLKELNPLTEIELNFKNDKGITALSKYLSFKFKRIAKNKKTIELIVTVIDITDQIILQKKLKESESRTKKQMEWLLSILHVEPQMLKDFIESVQKEIISIEYFMKQGNKEISYHQVLENIYRSVHLIKGNASLLDLKFFVNNTHEYEEKIAEIKSKQKITGSDFVPLILKLGDLRQSLKEINSLIERIGKFHFNFRPKRSYENLMLIKSIENLINNLSKDMGTKVQFIYKNFDGESIPYEYRILIKDILIQMVRNTMSHGIETSEERILKKKNPMGLIEVSTQIIDNIIVLKYFDDGRGIQTEKLKTKAKGLKKWDKIDGFDNKQISELIFETGITTSDKANVVSGRGLGMNIIKRKVEKYRGTVNFSSIQDQFCEFSISLPININQSKKKINSKPVKKVEIINN
jgi:ligand-binding sensor domain-containing protein/putative methionine-R-sulfoxide reductase with GAF domain/signal transduction histidine kinase